MAVSHTEKIIAFCRVLMAATTVAIAVVDPQQPSYEPEIGYCVLAAYFLSSALLFWLVRGEHVSQERMGYFSTATDIAWILAITLFTERGATPFFLLNIFLISSVSVRWGFAVAAPVTLLLAAMYPGIIFAAGRLLDPDLFAVHRAHLVRPLYLIVLGYLIGYLGEHERRSKRKLGFLLDLTTTFQRNRAPGWGISRLMLRVLHYFDSPRSVLVLRDPESGNYFTWDVTRAAGRVRVRLRITKTDPLPLSFAAPTDALLANSLQPGASALCYDVSTGSIHRKPMTPEIRLPDGEHAQALLAAPVLLQRELRGRAILVREGRRRFTRDDLEFLLLIVSQAAAGFEAVRLQEKAEEVAVLEERARIARDLHDGFIQSLAGIDLRVEACRKLVDRDPGRVPRQLEELHQMVDRGYREVRHYLTVLRSASRQADDLCATLDQLAAEFSIRDHLRVDLALPQSDPGLPAPTVYELAQIVREALRNAVRHGRATEAVVQLAADPSHCHIVIRDNGRGFQNARGLTDPDGFLAAAAAPWSIRDRAVALGGDLRVRSRPGEGAEISLLVPLAARAAESAAARRSE
ncbi:MAG TPA: histidine kinase [Candidatus Binatia bacterium]|jgi:signal transduction histidine kinase